MEQLDPYFAEEATEILQTIEKTLLSLFDEGKTTEKVHTLLRSAHTIKGSSASQNLETIQTVAHHLEDVFQALYAPELEIDSELSNLLLEGYECLRSPLSAILSNTPYDESAILDRVASVFAELQNKLGDFFGREASIPSSEELGFDVIGSLFSDSIAEDLYQLQNVVLSEDPDEIKQALSTQANFFLSIAQSYSLSGLEKISNTILAALESHPERILEIGLAALENLQEAQQVILAGDRTVGGEVSSELLAFAPQAVPEISNKIEEQSQETPLLSPTNTAAKTETLLSKESEVETVVLQEEIAQKTDVRGAKLEENTQKIIEEVEKNKSLISADSDSVKIPTIETLANHNAISALANQSTIDRIFNSIWTSDIETQENVNNALPTTSPKPQKNASNSTIRVNVELLDSINHSLGELIVEDNQFFLQSEQLNNRTENTIRQFLQCQKQIYKIHEWSDKKFRSSKSKKRKKRRRLKDNNYSQDIDSNLSLKEKKNPFDSLEMDTYNELHVLLQNLTEKIASLGEEIESIKTDIQQSHFQSRKRKQILFSARENLFEARMVEVSTVLNRFPRILQQMISTHKKPAKLNIIGSEVLIDKSILEKLYEPLLHLIRNSYDHGLESPEIRQKHGKPPSGEITIHASHQGNRTTLEVSDDGGGLNWEKIRQKALAKNLIDRDRLNTITETELTEILFESGFSTADKVSDLSGRGVGLDVVRNQLKAIDGSITARSVSGIGTTFTLQLPLKLTTDRLLVCQCWGITYSLVSKAIKQILLPNPQQIKIQESSEGREIKTYLLENDNEKLIPIRPLADLLKYLYPFKPKNNSYSLSNFPVNGQNNVNPLLILETKEGLFCLQVDRVLFEQEIVIKSLGNKINLPSYIQGYSVLGDGSLTSVIEPIELINKNWNRHNSISISPSPSENFKALEKPLKTTKLIAETKPNSNKIQPDLESQNITILAIEDSIVQRRTLVKILEQNGYRVLQAANGKEGLASLEKNPEIKLVLCDIEMPVMNGFEFLDSCRKHPHFSKIPLIMVTTRAGEKHKRLAYSLGATGYHTKPFSELALLEVISQLTNSN